mmetsp:Transcript_1240/g.1442  ORF Transcript_1240/g.1442 Transcript_1240/m.1442 type:complete len:178 (+) Transcript_1240:1195-1728(+)
MAFRMKSEIPTKTMYYLTKVIGTKNMKKNMGELKDYVAKCKDIGEQFAYFMNNEWVFDNMYANQLQKHLQDTFQDHQVLNFDVSKIRWKPFIQNHAYGIKRYVLKEEAYIPSEGYEDLRNRIFPPAISKVINPMQARKLFHKKITSFEDTKKIIFSSKMVREEIERQVILGLEQANN